MNSWSEQIEDDLQTAAVAWQQNKQDVDLANMMLLVGSLVGGVMWCLALNFQQEQVAFELIGGLSGAGIVLLVGCTIGYIGTTLGNYLEGTNPVQGTIRQTETQR